MNQPTTTRRSYRSWYLIKYLGLTCTISVILALIHLWRWPPVAEHTRKGMVFLSLALLCILLTKHKLLVLSLPLGIIACRAVFAAFLGVHPVESVIIAVASGSLFWIIAKGTAQRYKDLAIPEGYPLREIGIDIAIMGPLVLGIYFLHRLV
jgi:hypothetical protein